MKYRYSARNQKGTVETGIVDAPAENAAIETLQHQGLIITTLESMGAEGGTSGLKKELKIFKRGAKSKDLVFLMRQLSILVSSNVPLVEALHALAVQTTSPAFHEQIEEMANDVNGGMAFSEAIAKHPDTFSSFIINMIRVGEVGGTLPKVLNYLADHQEREYVLKSKIKGAMLYPILILATCVGVLILMVTFVLPRVSGMFKQFSAQLPAITRMMLNFSDFFAKYFFIFFIIAVGAVILFIRYIRTPNGRIRKDRTLLKIPVISMIYRNMYYARVCENLGTLIKGGIPIVQALDTVSTVIGNVLFEEILIEARDSVRRGEGMSPVFAKHPDIVAPTLTQMIENGEKSGKIEKILLDLSDFYNGEVTRSVDSLMTIIEPVLLIGIGGAVLLVAVAVIVPIYSLVNAIH